ncbi:ferritin [Kocuria polaris]|nr:ferritin [Kocuria polaris]
MELTGKLETAFNDQVTLELEASVVYRQLAIEMDVRDLPGIAGWFRAQSDEETVHAEKFIAHMTDRDSKPQIGDINAPKVGTTTVLEAFEASLAHEKKVSEAIRNLYRLAQQEGDIDALPLLNWFVSEQLEEEASVAEIIGRVKLISEDGNGLLRLDAELGSRTSNGTTADSE